MLLMLLACQLLLSVRVVNAAMLLLQPMLLLLLVFLCLQFCRAIAEFFPSESSWSCCCAGNVVAVVAVVAVVTAGLKFIECFVPN